MTQTKARWLAPLCTTILVLVGANAAHAQTAQEIAKKAFGSTVLLVMEDANGQPLSLGSGFFVRNGEIASNLHVVEGAARGYAKLVGQKAKYDIEGVTAVDAERDLVVLKVPASGSQAPSLILEGQRRNPFKLIEIPAFGSQSLSLGNSDAVQVGESVYAVGNPQGLEGTFSQGIVSSIREVGADKLLQITAPISPGSSGGPVLNGNGEVIGVSVATFRGGQNLNFAIPSNYLRALIAKAGPAKPLGRAKPARAERSITSDLGGRSSDGVTAGLFAWTWTAAQSGEYTFTLGNQLREDVKNVYCLVIFYHAEGWLVDVDVVRYEGLILAGLAKRVSSHVDPSVQKATTPFGATVPTAKFEFRILGFDIVN